MKALVLLAASAAFAQAPQLRTMGLTNGRIWTILSWESKASYVAGAVDAAIALAPKGEDPKMIPVTLSNGEVAKSLDNFYGDPDNALIPIFYAMSWIRLKTTGATAEALDRTLANMRRSSTESLTRERP